MAKLDTNTQAQYEKLVEKLRIANMMSFAQHAHLVKVEEENRELKEQIGALKKSQRRHNEP